MKRFLKMKFEMFMMRVFDWILDYFEKNDNLSWYPKYLLGDEEEIDRLEKENESLKTKLYSMTNEANIKQEDF